MLFVFVLQKGCQYMEGCISKT